MELSRRTIQRMILRKSGDTTVINQGSEGGGGGGGSVALGPLLTSLNAEAMPSAEGYLHWTGSAWAFDTPTGGDPVDLTPYALKTWVQDNFAYKNDLVNFITKTEADTYYAELSHTHANYLPLSAGANKALTGSLYFSGNSGINWAGGVGMLACTPESGWTGISSIQWGVGALSAQGVIRSNANDILHYRNGTNYKIWDAYNFTPSDYLPLTGGTVESLTVTNGLDADAITVGSIVNSDTLAEYLDADAMQTWGDGRYLKLTDKAGLFTQLANYDGALQITIGGTQKSLTIAYANAAGSANTAVNADKLDNHHAADFALASALGNYLPLTGGTVSGNVTMVGNNILFKRSAGGSYDGAILASTVTPQGYQSAVGCITIGGAVNFDNDDAPPMVNGRWLATQQWVGQQGYITQTAADGRYIKGVSVYGSPLTPDANRVVNIPYADINTPGVIQIGTGLVNSEGHTEVDTSVIASRSWANGQFVTVLGVSGEYLTYTKNGSTTNLTVPFATDSKTLRNFFDSRPTSANNLYGDGKLRHYMATSSMTTGKPSVDAHIIHSAWDYNNGYDAQLAIGNANSGLFFRTQSQGTWQAWKQVAILDDLSGYATQSWVNGRGFASAQDLYDLGTLVTTGYLPLTAGANKPLTGELFINKSAIASATSDVALAIANNWARTDIKDKSIGITIGASTDGYFTKIATVFESQNPDYLRPALAFYTMDSTYAAGTEVERMRIAANGNVGIGTTSPSKKLHVNGDALFEKWVTIKGNNDVVGLEISDTNGTHDFTAFWKTQTINNVSREIFTMYSYETKYWDMCIGTHPNAVGYGGLYMYNSGDNVLRWGIGTATPDSKLHVVNECHFAGGAKFNNICIEVDNSIAASGRGSEINNYNGQLLLQYNTNTHCSICYGGGNVGIGTRSPAYKLDVNGNTGVTGSLDVSIELSVGDVTNGGVWLSDSALGVWTMSGTSRQETELMSLASGGVTFSGDTIMTGKLAVGTTTFDGSNAKLQVGGNMFATGSITSKSNAGNVSLGNGNISATNLYISTVVFGSSNNDPAIYIGNGHVYARNSQGQTTMII